VIIQLPLVELLHLEKVSSTLLTAHLVILTMVESLIVSDTSLFKVSNSSFNNNSADNGGVIYSVESSFHIIDSTLHNNSATLGGAIHSVGGSFYIVNCTFRNNRGSTEGGVIAASSGSSFHVANSSFTNSNNNSSGFGAVAAAIGYCCSKILSFDQSSLNLSGNMHLF
jgi:predicted outer membrane repeat protein